MTVVVSGCFCCPTEFVLLLWDKYIFVCLFDKLKPIFDIQESAKLKRVRRYCGWQETNFSGF